MLLRLCELRARDLQCPSITPCVMNVYIHYVYDSQLCICSSTHKCCSCVYSSSFSLFSSLASVSAYTQSWEYESILWRMTIAESPGKPKMCDDQPMCKNTSPCMYIKLCDEKTSTTHGRPQGGTSRTSAACDPFLLPLLLFTMQNLVSGIVCHLRPSMHLHPIKVRFW